MDAAGWTAYGSRRGTGVRARGSGWTGGGDTVKPVKTIDRVLLGASAGSSRRRVDVSVRRTTWLGAGSVGARTLRRSVGTTGRADVLASGDRLRVGRIELTIEKHASNPADA